MIWFKIELLEIDGINSISLGISSKSILFILSILLLSATVSFLSSFTKIEFVHFGTPWGPSDFKSGWFVVYKVEL